MGDEDGLQVHSRVVIGMVYGFEALMSRHLNSDGEIHGKDGA